MQIDLIDRLLSILLIAGIIAIVTLIGYFIEKAIKKAKYAAMSDDDKALQAELLSEGFRKEQIEEILKGRKHKVDFGQYRDKSFHHSQMEQLRLGLEYGIDITPYKNVAYSGSQMFELRIAIENKVDISSLLDPKLSVDKMRTMRFKLMNK